MSREPGPIRRSLAVARQCLSGAETALICTLLLSMVGVSMLPVVERWIDWNAGYFARPDVQARLGWLRDLSWASAYLKHSVLWITVLGAALATKDRNHISIDVVGRLLKGRWKSGCLVLTNLFSAGVCAVAAWACFQFVTSQRSAFVEGSWDSAGKLFAHVPAWYAMAIMPIAFALMAMRFSIQTVEDAIAVWTGRTVSAAAIRLALVDPEPESDAAAGDSPAEPESPGDGADAEEKEVQPREAQDASEPGGEPC